MKDILKELTLLTDNVCPLDDKEQFLDKMNLIRTEATAKLYASYLGSDKDVVYEFTLKFADTMIDLMGKIRTNGPIPNSGMFGGAVTNNPNDHMNSSLNSLVFRAIRLFRMLITKYDLCANDGYTFIDISPFSLKEVQDLMINMHNIIHCLNEIDRITVCQISDRKNTLSVAMANIIVCGQETEFWREVFTNHIFWNHRRV